MSCERANFEHPHHQSVARRTQIGCVCAVRRTISVDREPWTWTNHQPRACPPPTGRRQSSTFRDFPLLSTRNHIARESRYLRRDRLECGTVPVQSGVSKKTTKVLIWFRQVSQQILRVGNSHRVRWSHRQKFWSRTHKRRWVAVCGEKFCLNFVGRFRQLARKQNRIEITFLPRGKNY